MYHGVLARMIEELGRMPGVGPKTAQRLAFHLLRQSHAQVEQLARTLIEAKEKLHYCGVCYSLCEEDECAICRDSRRDRAVVCVVEEPNDVFTLERTRMYQGLYHVLLGTLSPLAGVSPDDLKIAPLLERLKQGEIQEVILATNPSVEGEATAIYLSKLIKPLQLRVTRLASGLPAGGHLEYADDLTISQAFGGRREV